MGIYNTVHATVACPRCGVLGEVEIEVRTGNTSQMANLHIGDKYPWVARIPPKNGGRPDGGNVDGDGYMECEFCHKDSFMRIIIREDIIVGVEPDYGKRGYISN